MPGSRLLLAAVAWPFGGLRPTSPAQLASLVLMLAAVAVRRAWPWAAWSLGLAGGLIQVADGLPGWWRCWAWCSSCIA